MTLGSTTAAAETGNTGPEAGPSNAGNAGNAASNGNPGPEPSTVTISRADFEAMQAFMLQHSATLGSAAANVPGAVPPPDAVSVPGAAPGLAPGTAPGPITAPAAPPVAAPVPVVSTSYRGKAPKIDRYSGGSRGSYNNFVRQCEAAFDIEDNNTDAGRVAFGAARLEDTPADVWEACKLHHLNPDTITWTEFRI